MMAGLLTHLCQMEFRNVINWNSPLLFKGMLGGIFNFYSNFNRSFSKQYSKQTVENLILWRLIWFCTVCRYTTKSMLGLYRLIEGSYFQGGQSLGLLD